MESWKMDKGGSLKRICRGVLVVSAILSASLMVASPAMADTVDAQSFHFDPSSWTVTGGPFMSYQYNEAILNFNSAREAASSPEYVVPNLYEYICTGDGNPPSSGSTGLQETTLSYDFQLYGGYKTSGIAPTSEMFVIVKDLTKNTSFTVASFQNNEFAQLNTVEHEKVNLSPYSNDQIEIEFAMRSSSSGGDWYVVSNPVVRTTLIADSNSCSTYA